MATRPSLIEQECIKHGLRMTGQRRIIAKVISASHDHPDVDELHRRSTRIDKSIALSTVYRTVKLLEDNGILKRHDFGDGKARYEHADEHHHDHLIDTKTNDVIEFHSEEIEELQRQIAHKLGYRLTGHRMELYGVKLED